MPLPPIWPTTQHISPVADASIGMTVFTDTEQYHSALVQAMLKLEQDSPFKEKLPRGSCGTKIFDIDKWGVPEAELLHARAIEMFKRMLNVDEAAVDLCWGNVYRRNDYCVPHSHIRAQASVVYMLDAGEEDAKDRLAGQFYFADPRIPYCVQHEAGRMTRLLVPQMRPGCMLIFPGLTVHGVNPYFGARPRMTLSWNINRQAVPGSAREDFEAKLNKS